MGPEGYIPSMLVFGTLPTFPGGKSNDREQELRMEVIRVTRREIETITAELRIKAALKARLPPSTEFDIRPGMRVRVYREAIKRWEGPFNVARTMGKQIWVTDGASTKQFNCTQVLPDPADTADREMSRLLEGFQNLNSGGYPAYL